MKIGNMLWGIVLIVLGVIFGLNALEITNINVFFSGWWTLFIIVPCAIELLKGKDFTSNMIGLFIGVALLLACNDIITFEIIAKLFLPTILVLIGLTLIFKDTINTKVKNKIKNIVPTSSDDYYAVFGNTTITPKENDINGADINAIFGGFRCDLSDTKITKDIVINATSIFGGVKIITPKNVNVVVNAFPIFGGVSNKVNTNDSKYTIYVKGTVMFGGIDIK